MAEMVAASKPARPVVDAAGARRADLAAIHIAKKALGMDDDSYRDVMFTVAGVRSSANMDFAARKRFLAHLRACQAASTPGRAKTTAALLLPMTTCGTAREVASGDQQGL